ncbi:hypothetical protein AtubIFM54640_002500 [Aspergillus tubingensis]|nr:hypothetical protein AtubIFM54640_002500 [Aspergillus tubingensis]
MKFQEIKRGISIPRLSHFLLLFLFAFNSLVNAAYDINDGEKDYAKEGDTALGIKLDLNFARTWPNVDPKDSTVIRNWVFSSHLKFKGLVNDETNGIEDEQLWQIALTGYNEMQANQEAYGIPKRQRSKAMTVLAFDHELILASSQKGESFSYYYTDTPVAKALERCQVTWRRDFGKESIHKNEGKCGEEMAAHLYYLVHPGKSLSSQKPRVATIVGGKRTDPCTDNKGEKFGCSTFVQEYGIEVVDANKEFKEFSLSEIAGGIEKRSQIQLCYSPDTSSNSKK